MIAGACVHHGGCIGKEIDRLCIIAASSVQIASRNGHMSVVRSLLTLRARLDLSRGDLCSAAMKMPEREHDWPPACFGLTPQTDNKPDTAIALAAWSGHTSIVRLLLASGARILHLPNAHLAAVASGQCFVAEFILQKMREHGQIPFGENGNVKYEKQCFMEACKAGNIHGVLRFLRESEESSDTKHAAVLAAIDNGQVGVLRFLEESGVSLAHENVSPLVVAASFGNAEVVDFLLERTPLDPDALIVAASCGFIDIVSRLISKHAHVDHRSHEGGIALVESAASGCLDVVEVLLASRASPLVRDGEGKTALSAALGNGFLEIAKFLSQRMPPNFWTTSMVFIPKNDTFPSKKGCKRISVACLPALRFPIGCNVCCNMGSRTARGTVVRQWHHEPSWPKNCISPYQVRVAEGQLIGAPKDEDGTIHSVAEFGCRDDALASPGKLYVRVLTGLPTHRACTGVYVKVALDGFGVDFWKHASEDRFLYHGDDLWLYIGDIEERALNFQCASGYVRSVPSCRTCHPTTQWAHGSSMATMKEIGFGTRIYSFLTRNLFWLASRPP